MLSSLLVRLTMVALTMAVVCWIGWIVPVSHEMETSHASGSPEADRPPLVAAPLPAPPASSTPLPEPRQEKFSRRSATGALDLNRATEEELERLPGIGPVLAGRIVEYRKARGAFEDIEQLRQVKGIGKKTFERLRAFVAVGPFGVSKAARKTA